MFSRRQPRHLVSMVVCFLLPFTALAQGDTSYKMVFEMPSEDQPIPPDQVVKICSELIANRGKHTPDAIAKALFHRGDAYRRLGKLEEALTDYVAVCEIEPTHGTALCNRALVLAQLNRTDEAIDMARKIIIADPKLTPAYLVLGDIFLSQGKYDAALGSAKMALTVDPNFARAYLLRAIIAERQGDYKECLAMVNRYLEQHPLPNLREQDFPYRMRGLLMLRLNRPKDSLNNFLLARKLNPSAILAGEGVYTAYQDLQKWHMAIKAHEHVVELEPKVSLHHVLLAYAQAKTGAIKAARKSMEEAVRFEPLPEPFLMANKGQVYFLLGKYDLAEGHFALALDRNKNLGPAILGKAVLLATCSESEYRDGAEALKLAKQYQELAKKSWGADHYSHFLLLADAEAECGNFPEALRHARKSLELAGKDRELAEFQERIKLLENKKPYRYVVPAE